MKKSTSYTWFALSGKLLLCCLLLLAAALQPARAQIRIYPGDSEYTFDVTKPPYNAPKNGSGDATPGIQKAIDAIIKLRVDYINANCGGGSVRSVGHQTLYFPNGTYLINKPLNFGGKITLRADCVCEDANGNVIDCPIPDAPQLQIHVKGESRSGTIIKLIDGSLKFKDPPSLDPATAAKQTMLNFYSSESSGNDLFSNSIETLTIDAGIGHPGAIGLNFHNNNVGYIRQVTIQSADKQGAIGLRLGSDLSGIGSVQDVTVKGFNYGIVNGADNGGQWHAIYNLERINLSDQKIAGIRSRGKGLTIKNLTSVNTVSAVVQDWGSGQVVLLDSDLSGGTSTYAAINNAASASPDNDLVGWLVVRDVKIKGYTQGIRENGSCKSGSNDSGCSIKTAPGGDGYVTLPEYVTGGIKRLPFSSQAPNKTKGLTVPSTPTPPYQTSSGQSWTVLTSTQTQRDADANIDTKNIQKAVDSGKPTIFFERGKYYINKTIHVRKNTTTGGAVSRINGNWSQFFLTDSMKANNNAAEQPKPPVPVFQIDDDGADSLLIEAIDCAFSAGGGNTWFYQNNSTKKLVLKDSFLPYGAAYRGLANTNGTKPNGDLFVENVCSGGATSSYKNEVGWLINRGSRMFAHSFNHEGTWPHLMNDWGQVWVLGFKFGERYGPFIHTQNGGVTEMLGGIINQTVNYPASNQYVIINDKSDVSISLLQKETAAVEDTGIIPYMVMETQGTTTLTLASNALPPRENTLKSPVLTHYRGKHSSSTPGRLAAAEQEPIAEDQQVFFYPNPATGETTMVYNLPEPARVVINLYDSQGKKVKPLLDSYQVAGKHQLVVNGQLLANGLYVCRLQANQRVQSTKLLISK